VCGWGETRLRRCSIKQQLHAWLELIQGPRPPSLASRLNRDTGLDLHGPWRRAGPQENGVVCLVARIHPRFTPTGGSGRHCGRGCSAAAVFPGPWCCSSNNIQHSSPRSARMAGARGCSMSVRPAVRSDWSAARQDHRACVGIHEGRTRSELGSSRAGIGRRPSPRRSKRLAAVILREEQWETIVGCGSSPKQQRAVLANMHALLSRSE